MSREMLFICLHMHMPKSLCQSYSLLEFTESCEDQILEHCLALSPLKYYLRRSLRGWIAQKRICSMNI